jgi:hypothetical protein
MMLVRKVFFEQHELIIPDEEEDGIIDDTIG